MTTFHMLQNLEEPFNVKQRHGKNLEDPKWTSADENYNV